MVLLLKYKISYTSISSTLLYINVYSDAETSCEKLENDLPDYYIKNTCITEELEDILYDGVYEWLDLIGYDFSVKELSKALLQSLDLEEGDCVTFLDLSVELVNDIKPKAPDSLVLKTVYEVKGIRKDGITFIGKANNIVYFESDKG